MEKLKPCPFCGSKRININGFDGWYIACDECDCFLGSYCQRDTGMCGWFNTEQDAITAWNTREKTK